jgi:hypothetical protein
VKLAGRKSVARKSVGVFEASGAFARGEGYKVLSDSERREVSRTALSVRAVEDDPHSEWFLRPDAESVANEDERAALDAMLERHGLINVIEALAQLLESRVDESLLVNGRLIAHLAREDAYAHAADSLRRLKYDQRIRDL